MAVMSNFCESPENSRAVFVSPVTVHVVGMVVVALMLLLPEGIGGLVRDHAWRLLLVPLLLVLASPFERAITLLAGEGERRPFLVALLLGLLMSVALLWRVLPAEWSPIDDHEIPKFLGTDWHISLSELPSTALQTEIKNWGASKRYRPIYYSLRLLECWAWGANLGLWYTVRIALLGITLGCSFFIMRRPLGWLAAIALTAFLMTESFWADIWARLGPSEIYCVPGTALFLVGFQLLWNFRSLSPGRVAPASALVPGLTALSLGFLMAVGSKENYLILCLPVAVLLVRSLAVRPVLRGVSLVCGLLLTLGALLAIGIVRGVSTFGHVYGMSVSVSASSLLRSLIIPEFFPFWVGVALALAATYLMWVRLATADRSGVIVSMMRPWMLWMGAGLMTYLSQVAFFGEPWPTNIRYDFPGVIVPLVFPALLFGLVHKGAEKTGFAPEPLRILRGWLVVGLTALIVIKGFSSLTGATLRQVSTTKRYTSALQSLVQIASQNPKMPIVMYSSDPFDHEPMIGTSWFLASFRVQNPLYMEIRHAKSSLGDPRRERVSKELQRRSINGWGNVFHPKSELDDAPHIGALFSGDQAGRHCWKSVRLY